ncbi:DUF624 domain-containing protein [Alkalicoccus luteus]|uniref:DUF624 domain-containing protein n=1 Tax=Alkalicoccus luteus TaxID=1237094 RepID=UPI0040343BD0
MRASYDVFYKSIFETYKDLGAVALFTLLWALSLLPIATAGAGTAALYSCMREKQLGKNVSAGDFICAVRRHFKKGLILQLLYAGFLIPALGTSLLLLSDGTVVGIAMSVLLLYTAVLWQLMFLYVWPLLAADPAQTNSMILLRAFKLVSDHFWYSICIAIYVFLLVLLSSIITVALLIAAGATAILLNNAAMKLLQGYDPEAHQFESDVSWKGSLRPWKI